MKLVGRTALVTGGGQGVGAAVAQRLVAEGATQVALLGRSPDSLARTAAALRADGAEVLEVQADLTEVEDCRRAVRDTEAAFGAIDILCNCAGATDRGTIFDTSPETFDKLFATNVRGAFFLVQAALPAMVAQKSGVVVSISSMLAHGGIPHLVAYSASKAALNAMTRNIANAVRHDRVRAHAINLGWTVTPAEHVTQTEIHGLPENWVEVEGPKQPFGRLLTAEDCAGVVAFLASEDAAMMTGNIVDLEQWVLGTLDAR